MRGLIATVFVPILGLISCAASTGQQQRAEAKNPPSITYGNSRSSSKWINTGSVSVAVDEGIEWEGVRAYLSLTWELLAVDAKTGKTLWSHSVGAFWNAMGIKEVELERGKKTWAIELRPTSRDERTKNLTALYDLKSGKELEVPGQNPKPSGTAFKPRREYSGERTQLARGFSLMVTTAENWEKVREKLFKGLDKADAPAAKDIDFSKEVLAVISGGDMTNCRGIGCEEAYEDDKRVLVRMHYATFQTLGRNGGGVQLRPYGIIVLPRKDKAYVFEHNRQRYIGGPPLWTEVSRVEKLPDPARELDKLP